MYTLIGLKIDLNGGGQYTSTVEKIIGIGFIEIETLIVVG